MENFFSMVLQQKVAHDHDDSILLLIETPLF